MSINGQDVILCKGLSERNDSQEEYVSHLKSAGYNCIILPTLTFKFVNADTLRECLSHPECYHGLILTSPRSIEAINYAIQGKIHEDWRKLPAYCVGPSTQSLGKSCLELENSVGSQCGNAEELAKYIVRNSKSIDKSLFYPCSAIARDKLPQILESDGVKFDKLVVYETQPAETLKQSLMEIITELPQIFVFFSPSIVEYIVNVAQKNSISLNKIISVAIGPVTAATLDRVGLPVHAIAGKPEPGALVEAIRNIGKQQEHE